MKSFASLATAALAVLALTGGTASAATNVNWTNWTNQTTATHVDGTLSLGMANVNVGYEGAIYFAQTNGAAASVFGQVAANGVDYWDNNGFSPGFGGAPYTADEYTQGQVNRPTGTDIISLNAGGTKTITFSQAVVNPYFAFTSWNTNDVTFSSPYTLISQGCGYWGCGTFTQVNSTRIQGNSEVHGILQFQGNFTQISFTDTSELWHGFTVGAEGVAVPEPATWAMMIMGFGAAGAVLRRRQRTLAA